MQTIQFSDEKDKTLTSLLTKLKQYKRWIAVVGAGISVSSGIPDFRSSNGLYNTAKTQKVTNGKDMFDVSILKNEETSTEFFKFISRLYKMCKEAKPTKSHEFFKFLNDSKLLMRLYTQNIDCLEDRVEICASKSIKLHGSLDSLKCTVCRKKIVCEDTHIDFYEAGEAPECSICRDFVDARKAAGRRETAVGILRPNIVLYNETHTEGEMIAEMINKDIRKTPEILIVMGTSLKVTGIKQLVKQFSKCIKAHGHGLCIFVNKTPLTEASWKSVFDYQIIGEADAIVSAIRSSLTSKVEEQGKGQQKIEKYFAKVKALPVAIKDKENKGQSRNEKVEKKAEKIGPVKAIPKTKAKPIAIK